MKIARLLTVFEILIIVAVSLLTCLPLIKDLNKLNLNSLIVNTQLLQMLQNGQIKILSQRMISVNNKMYYEILAKVPPGLVFKTEKSNIKVKINGKTYNVTFHVLKASSETIKIIIEMPKELVTELRKKGSMVINGNIKVLFRSMKLPLDINFNFNITRRERV